VAMMSQFRERTGNRAAWSLYNPEGDFACFVGADMAEPPQESSEETLALVPDTRVSYTLTAAGARAWNQTRGLGVPALPSRVAGHLYSDTLRDLFQALGHALFIGNCLTEGNMVSLQSRLPDRRPALRPNQLQRPDRLRRLNINWNAQVEFQLTEAGVATWQNYYVQLDADQPAVLPHVTYRRSLWEVAHAPGKLFSEVLVDGQLTCKVRQQGQWWEAL